MYGSFWSSSRNLISKETKHVKIIKVEEFCREKNFCRGKIDSEFTVEFVVDGKRMTHRMHITSADILTASTTTILPNSI